VNVPRTPVYTAYAYVAYYVASGQCVHYRR